LLSQHLEDELNRLGTYIQSTDITAETCTNNEISLHSCDHDKNANPNSITSWYRAFLLPGQFALWNFRSLNVYLTVYSLNGSITNLYSTE